MKLLKIRLRGLDRQLQTSWFAPSDQFNLLSVTDPATGLSILKLLETLNPPYKRADYAPFDTASAIVTDGRYTKKIHAEKRTVAIGVFSSTPSLASELGRLDPALYEIDRIEVGRRLDFSHWLNFVEVAFSTRLSEISSDLETLRKLLDSQWPLAAEALHTLLEGRQPSDRVTFDLQDGLAGWLESLPTEIKDIKPNLYLSLMQKVLRADHFSQARRQVFARMPLLVIANNPDSIKGLLAMAETARDNQDTIPDLMAQVRQNPAGTVARLQAVSELAITLSAHRRLAPPILLFDCPEQRLDSSSRSRLLQFFSDLAPRIQCFCTTTNRNNFPDKSDINVYDYETLITTQSPYSVMQTP